VVVDVQLYVVWYGLAVTVPPPVSPVTVGNATCLIADSTSDVVAVTVAEPDVVP
jgi:hypothetical protein